MQTVMHLADLWEGEPQSRRISGENVLLARIGDRVCAYVDRCPHLGAPLSRGAQDGHVLTCSIHHWQFDLRDGTGVNPSGTRLQALPLEVRDGAICVAVPATPAERADECR
jgi:nitrite reductase/ring-hydroxylating ferredoxin subunit